MSRSSFDEVTFAVALIGMLVVGGGPSAAAPVPPTYSVTRLPTGNFPFGVARGISADGTVIVGSVSIVGSGSALFFGESQAAVWHVGVPTTLEVLATGEAPSDPGPGNGIATAVSPDGSKIVGLSNFGVGSDGLLSTGAAKFPVPPEPGLGTVFFSPTFGDWRQ